MTEPNDNDDLVHRFIDHHPNCMVPLHSNLIVIKRKGNYKILEEGLTELCNARGKSLLIFYSVKECSDFVGSKEANNELVLFTVHVQFELADQLIPDIARNDKVQNIVIIGGRSASLEERDRMKVYPKVSHFSEDN